MHHPSKVNDKPFLLRDFPMVLFVEAKDHTAVRLVLVSLAGESEHQVLWFQ